jgi:hypothetical protein
VGAAGSLAAAAVVGAPASIAAGTVVGHHSVSPPFLTAGVSAPAGPTGVASPLDVVDAIGAPAGIVTGTAGPRATVAVASTLNWPSFGPSMGGASY